MHLTVTVLFISWLNTRNINDIAIEPYQRDGGKKGIVISRFYFIFVLEKILCSKQVFLTKTRLQLTAMNNVKKIQRRNLVKSRRNM